MTGVALGGSWDVTTALAGGGNTVMATGTAASHRRVIEHHRVPGRLGDMAHITSGIGREMAGGLTCSTDPVMTARTTTGGRGVVEVDRAPAGLRGMAGITGRIGGDMAG